MCHVYFNWKQLWRDIIFMVLLFAAAWEWKVVKWFYWKLKNYYEYSLFLYFDILEMNWAYVKFRENKQIDFIVFENGEVRVASYNDMTFMESLIFIWNEALKIVVWVKNER